MRGGRALTDLFRTIESGCSCPQNVIGQGEELDRLAPNLEVWREVCTTIWAEFWVNCKTVTVTDRCHPVMQIESAEPRRLMCEMATAEAAGAKKLVTWEAIRRTAWRNPPPHRKFGRACCHPLAPVATVKVGTVPC